MRVLGAFSASAMTGIIWYVQLVHYPLFAEVGDDIWFAFHADHERRTGWVVAPLMIAELTSAAGTVLLSGPGVLALAGLALAAATWGLTFTLAVPLHRRLNRTRDPDVIERLVRINWLRTAAWSAHGLVAVALLAA